jgi:hypothetical protein
VAMKTHLEFKSNKFPAYDGEEQQINPGLWGKRLAEYLEQNLKAHGFETKRMNPEDWGWCLPIRNDDFSLWIGCGHQSGDNDEFLCFIHPDKAVIRKWFKTINTAEKIGRLANALEKILTSDPAIRDFRWRDETEK